jgi:hypothetical protein
VTHTHTNSYFRGFHFCLCIHTRRHLTILYIVVLVVHGIIIIIIIIIIEQANEDVGFLLLLLAANLVQAAVPVTFSFLFDRTLLRDKYCKLI